MLPLWVCPTRFESAAIRKALSAPLRAGRLRLRTCGVGPVQAARFCQSLEPQQVARLVLIGWAGGLDPGLSVGDVVCATQALMIGCPNLDNLFVPDSLKTPAGPLLTSPVALSTPAQKAAAWQTVGALAVEMEAYPFAAWAAEHRIPFTHIRVILDAAAEPLFSPGIVGLYRLLRQAQAVERPLMQAAREVEADNGFLTRI